MVLTSAQMPAHTHMLLGSSQPASSDSLSGHVLATSNGNVTSSVEAVSVNSYAAASATPVTADPHAISSAGSSAPVSTMQPYLCMNYCIATIGIYPNRP